MPHVENKIVLREGKTKVVRPHPTASNLAIFEAKVDITAGDGAKRDVIPGKARLATTTTVNVFRLLQDADISVTFREQDSSTSFIAELCEMLPFEVVVRRSVVPASSYLKRHRHIPLDHTFSRLIVEFFLKTTGQQWEDTSLPVDDPLILFGNDGKASLFHPKHFVNSEAPIAKIPMPKSFGTPAGRAQLANEARRIFLILEQAWRLQGLKLVDLKVEFGTNTKGEYVLADVIDNDSWRLLDEGDHLDKQVYRDGQGLDEVASRYILVAERTSRFHIPRQQIIIWCGSVKDDLRSFDDAMATLGVPEAFRKYEKVFCSVHKEPMKALAELDRQLGLVPDSVVIAYVGRSNGTGPVLAAHTTVPVIAVPAEFEKFPDDVWSSLRMPSNVPLMTVLDPGNAFLAALQILAARNPALYAALRFRQEKRFENTISIGS